MWLWLCRLAVLDNIVIVNGRTLYTVTFLVNTLAIETVEMRCLKSVEG